MSYHNNQMKDNGDLDQDGVVAGDRQVRDMLYFQGEANRLCCKIGYAVTQRGGKDHSKNWGCVARWIKLVFTKSGKPEGREDQREGGRNQGFNFGHINVRLVWKCEPSLFWHLCVMLILSLSLCLCHKFSSSLFSLPLFLHPSSPHTPWVHFLNFPAPNPHIKYMN